jgi:uncharacterized protein YhbP (UPF0306 family)
MESVMLKHRIKPKTKGVKISKRDRIEFVAYLFTIQEDLIKENESYKITSIEIDVFNNGLGIGRKLKWKV